LESPGRLGAPGKGIGSGKPWKSLEIVVVVLEILFLRFPALAYCRE